MKHNSISIILIGIFILTEEVIQERKSILLGGETKFTREAANSPESRKKVKNALIKLSADSGNCYHYATFDIISGTTQVINGIKYKFVVKAKGLPTGVCSSKNVHVDQTFEITHIDLADPTSEGPEIYYEEL